MHNKKMPAEFIRDFSDLQQEQRDIVIATVRNMANRARKRRPQLHLIVGGSSPNLPPHLPDGARIVKN